MNYSWDIDVWAKQQTPEEIRQEPLNTDIKFRLNGVKTLYNEFVTYRTAIIKRMRYNAQTIVMRNLLNDLFDNDLRRIRVITTYDEITPLYIFNEAENEPVYIYTEDELIADPLIERKYIYNIDELAVLYDFIIEAAPGSLTDEQIVRLKATVNYYRLFGKKPGYFYSNNTPF